MTRHLRLPAITVLTLLVLSGCSPRDLAKAKAAGLDSRPGTAFGITTFGDASLGVTFN